MDRTQALAKVPAVTLGFWVIKILATTLGETGGDAVSMTYDFGYLVSSAIFIIPLILLVAAQIRARGFHPVLYWATIIASTTAGTTMADFATRSIGIGYPGGSLVLLGAVLASLWLWYRTLGSVDVGTVATPTAEAFYWVTITFSQTLGTALGDWLAAGPDEAVPGIGMGYLGAASVFAAGLAVVALLYYRSKVSRVGLFWATFILTRPLGATVGDFLDKPLAKGGLDFSRPVATAVLLFAIAALIWLLPQRAGEHPKA